MKKKLIITSLAVASILTFSQQHDDTVNRTERRFWGSEITAYGPCTPTGVIMADGNAQCACEVEVTYYVLWVGVEKHIETRYVTC